MVSVHRIDFWQELRHEKTHSSIAAFPSRLSNHRNRSQRGRHDSARANHQHDHEPTHSEQDGWDIRGITDCDAHVNPAFSSHQMSFSVEILRCLIQRAG